MNRNDDDIDTIIRGALSEEEAAFYDRLAEPSLFEMATDVFRGRHRWIAMMTVAVMTVMMAGAVTSLVMFFRAEGVHDMLTWVVGFFFCMCAVLGMKVWHWMEMNRMATTREVKRVELQLAHLTAAMRERSGSAAS